jgi:hypothetical protein
VEDADAGVVVVADDTEAAGVVMRATGDEEAEGIAGRLLM